MSTYLKVIITTVLFGCSLLCNSQTLHKLSKDLPQINKEFQFNVYVTVDSLRETNVTPEQFEAVIAGANQMFSPIAVSFAICKWDTIHDYNFDILIQGPEDAELKTLWSEDQVMNVYLVGQINEEPDIICGFAGGRFVTLNKACMGALTHELGHCFGLAHTFEGNGTENVNGSNCDTAGDGICDTPADPYDPNDDITVWQDGCEFIYEGLDANGEYYQPDVGNIMSYYSCRCGFTHGQYVSMANTILNSFNKVW